MGEQRRAEDVGRGRGDASGGAEDVGPRARGLGRVVGSVGVMGRGIFLERDGGIGWRAVLGAGRGGRAGRGEEKGGPRFCLNSILFMSRDTQISNSKAVQIETSKSHLQAQPKKLKVSNQLKQKPLYGPLFFMGPIWQGPTLHPPSRSPRAATALPLGPPLPPVTLPVHAIYAAMHTSHNGEAVFALGLWGRARGVLAAAASSSGVPRLLLPLDTARTPTQRGGPRGALNQVKLRIFPAP
jgi:hypothetical protein